MMRRRRRRIRALPVNSLVPNILTVLALCAGMTSIRFSLEERWPLAVLAIIVAAILDGLDGRMARLLKGATRFGAELDSLSDFIAFGVAPAMLLYLWSAGELGGLGWTAALAYATCCGLRLARFNTALDDPDRPPWHNLFFTGVAAPAGAGFALLPVLLSFQFGDVVVRTPAVVALWLVVIAFLMVSQIPTYSFKRLRVRREHVLPTLVVVGFLAAVIVSYPSFAMSAMVIAYICTIPFSIRSHRRLLGQETGPDAAHATTEPGGEPAVDTDPSSEEEDEVGEPEQARTPPPL